MGRGPDKPHQPEPFHMRFHGGRWQVRHGKRGGDNWRFAREVSLLAAALTQPAGEIHGVGVVRWKDGVAVITS